MQKFELHHGDCLEVLRTLPDNSVDAIVTDPPYGLTANKKGGTGTASVNLDNPYGRARIGTGNGAGGFMGMKWDSDVPSQEVWAECLRVLKPGGHLLAFAGTRTQHRMAVRIEDAGFEIRDMIAWVYGSGFPKSHNLRGDWQGWGTALKPALEPITVARKPLAGTVAENVLEHGTGALNIDGCRVEPTGESRERVGEASQERRYTEAGGTDFAAKPGVRGGDPAGRWPANLIHDGSDEVVSCFPANAGASAPVKGTEASWASVGRVTGERERVAGAFHADTGSAARFFYCAKASRSDRNEGLQDPGPQFKHGTTLRQIENTVKTGNTHPTVKPTDLMRYLCRLVTPPGGVVLDPFMGSGSTGKAAMLEGFRFIGIEREAEYLEIARARIACKAPQEPENTPMQPGTAAPACAGQFDLFSEAA